jgi:hypothetical protein
MAIVNRDLAPSQQVRVTDRSFGLVATGVTSIIALAEAPCQVVAGAVKAFGLSGSPVWTFQILRTVSGGLTTIGLGATITLLEGTTYTQGISFSLGSTSSAFLQTGDALMLTTSGANTAALSAMVNVELKAIQDVKTFFGTTL